MANNLSDVTGKNFEQPILGSEIGDPAKMTDKELQNAIAATTGVDLTSRMVYRDAAEAKMGETPATYNELDQVDDEAEREEDAVSAAVPGVGSIMSPEEAAKLGISSEGGNVIDPEDSYRENMEKKVKQIREAEASGYQAMEDAAVQAEQERMDRLEATLALPDDHPDKIALLGDRKKAVETAERTERDRRESDRVLEGVGEYDPNDLIPGYTITDEEETAEVPKAEEPADPTPDDDDYGEFVRSLPVSEFTPTTTPVVVPKRTPAISEVPSDWNKKKNSQPLGDQAFLNAVAKFKKNNFGVVRVPLINSGFYIDVVGTGEVDLQNLYMNVDPDTQMYNYQMEQMRVLIQNVVGTTPKIDPTTLKDRIHYADFNMLAFAHVCATLDKAESVANCTHCGMAFRTNGKPSELLMNMDKLNEKAMLITNAATIDDYSLLSKYRRIVSSNGFIITLGHPSYANELGMLNSFVTYYNQMTSQEANRFSSLLHTMRMVRKIALPNGVQTNSLLQIYEALKLLNQEDLQLVQREISALYDEIIMPEFGIREVVCPHCGKVVKEVAYNDMLSLLFMHTQLNGYLHEKTEQQ